MSLERWNSRWGDPVEKRIIQDGKVGATAGWTVRGAADSFMATMAASQTAGTLVVPLPNLKKGDLLVGYDLIGQIESGGNAVTLDCQLFESLPVAAASTHTAIAGTSMDQISVTADTKISKDSARKLFDPFEKEVQEDAAYFALITGTTLGATDIEFLGLILHVRPER